MRQTWSGDAELVEDAAKAHQPLHPKIESACLR